MIADVVRAYTPTVDFKSQSFQQLSLATIQGQTGGTSQMCYVPLIATLVHRKVFVLLWSISGTFSLDADLVATSNGREVLAMKFVVWNTAAQNRKFKFGFHDVTTNIGGINEQLFTLIAGTNYVAVSPHRLNIACDAMYIRANSITGGAAAFDAILNVQSQAGI
jgi:hypothetical protein